MKYKGREIVAPEKFLPAMRELLAWYEGGDLKSDFCPLCQISNKQCKSTWEDRCKYCPWTIVEKRECSERARGGFVDAARMREGRPKQWSTMRIRQLRRWIAIYEKAAAEAGQ